jgi:hypothetical protein
MQCPGFTAWAKHRNEDTYYTNTFKINQNMKRIETRNHIKSIVENYPEGISLTQLHNKFQRTVTRLQLRSLLGVLYMNGEITRQRVSMLSRRVTKYYPFNGSEPVKRKLKHLKERNKKMLSMKDFMPGKKYQAYIEQ